MKKKSIRMLIINNDCIDNVNSQRTPKFKKKSVKLSWNFRFDWIVIDRVRTKASKQSKQPSVCPCLPRVRDRDLQSARADRANESEKKRASRGNTLRYWCAYLMPYLQDKKCIQASSSWKDNLQGKCQTLFSNATLCRIVKYIIILAQ